PTLWLAIAHVSVRCLGSSSACPSHCSAKFRIDHGYPSLTETVLADFPNGTNVANDTEVTPDPTVLKSGLIKELNDENRQNLSMCPNIGSLSAATCCRRGTDRPVRRCRQRLAAEPRRSDYH